VKNNSPRATKRRSRLFLPAFISALLAAGFTTGSWAGPNSWTPLGPGGAAVESIAVAPSDAQKIYVSFTNSPRTIEVSTNAGATWSKIATAATSPSRFVVAPNTSTTVYAIDVYGYVSKSTDGAATWTAIAPNFEFGFYAVDSLAIDPSNENVIFAGTSYSGLFKSVDGGVNWARAGNFPVPIGTSEPVTDIVIDPAQHQRIDALEGSPFRSLDGGTTWTDIRGDLPSSVSPNRLAVDPSDAQTIFIAADQSGIYKTVDGGSHWNGPAAGSAGFAFRVLAIDPESPAHIYAGTAQNGLLQSSDSGANWGPATNLCSSTVSSIEIDPGDHTHVTLGGSGGYFESSDSGADWTRRTNGLPDSDAVAFSIDPSNPSHFYLATYGSGVWETTDAGGTWAQLCDPAANANVLSLAVGWSPPLTLYVGTEDGVFRSVNGGAEWTSEGLSGRPIGSMIVDPTDSTHVYAGDNFTFRHNSNNLFFSNDSGDHWSDPVTSLPSFSAVCGFAVDPDGVAVYVAWVRPCCSTGNVSKSTDGGANWANTHVPEDHPTNAVSLDPAHPKTIWASTDAKIYRSTDGGGAWTIFTNFGAVGVVPDPNDPSTVYINVPSLAKTTDGGATWRSFSGPGFLQHFALDPANSDRVYGAFIGSGLQVLDQVPPQVDSIAPASGNTTGGTTVTIHGQYFLRSMTVLVDGTSVIPSTTTSTTITFVTPPHSTGPVDIEVIAPSGQSATLPSSFTYECLSPFTALVGGGGAYCEASGGSGQIYATLSGVGPWTIDWSDGVEQHADSSFADRFVSPAETTDYTIISVSDSSGCGAGEASGSATVTVYPLPAAPVITAPLSVPPFVQSSASVPPADGVSYIWSVTLGPADIVDGGSAQIAFLPFVAGVPIELSIFEFDTTHGCHSETSSAPIFVDFLDVPAGRALHDEVDAIAQHHVTNGCDIEGDFCPNRTVNRLQMAAFLARAHDGGDEFIPASGSVNGTPYDCDAGPSYFSDVPPSNPFCRHVNRIAALGITLGCSPQAYCPSGIVSRGQMALFIAREIAPGGAPPSSYSDGATGRSYDCSIAPPLTDVAANSATCNAVGYIWAKGIVDGFGDGTFHPLGSLTRAPMAKFIARGFDLRLGQ